MVIFGIFDGVHEGHLSLFAQAKEYGDELVAIVGRDSASIMWKGKKPKHSQETRLGLVLKEEDVDVAVLGDEEQSTYIALQELNPDIVCFGYDQDNLAKDLQIWMQKTGMKISLHRLDAHQPEKYHNSVL